MNCLCGHQAALGWGRYVGTDWEGDGVGSQGRTSGDGRYVHSDHDNDNNDDGVNNNIHHHSYLTSSKAAVDKRSFGMYSRMVKFYIQGHYLYNIDIVKYCDIS
jgi:hypothetical protein